MINLMDMIGHAEMLKSEDSQNKEYNKALCELIGLSFRVSKEDIARCLNINL